LNKKERNAKITEAISIAKLELKLKSNLKRFKTKNFLIKGKTYDTFSLETANTSD
jgi:hypothetical protein